MLAIPALPAKATVMLALFSVLLCSSQSLVPHVPAGPLVDPARPAGLATSDWSEDIRVTNTSGASIFPDLGIGPDGSLNFVWVENYPYPLVLFFKKLSTHGAVLVPETKITFWTEGRSSHSSEDIGDPRIAVDRWGNSHILWRDLRDSGSERIAVNLYYKMLDPEGGTLINDTLLTPLDDDLQPRFYSLAVDGEGKVHMAWDADITVGRSGVVYSLLDPSRDDRDGDPASRTQVLVVDQRMLAINRTYPHLGLDGTGNVHLAFADYTTGRYPDTPLEYMMLDNRSATVLIDRTVISASAKEVAHTSLFVDSRNHVHVAREDQRSDWNVLYVRLDPYRDDRDGDAADASVITEVEELDVSQVQGRFSVFPSVVADREGNASVAWWDAGSPRDYLDRTIVDPAGRISLLRENVTTRYRPHAFTFMSSGGIDASDRVFVAWDDNRLGQSEIFMKHTRGTSTPEDRPPVADAGGAYVGEEGMPMEFDASASSDPDGDTLRFRWDFESDGVWDTNWSGSSTASFVFGDDFSGVATVAVTDGTLTGTATAPLTVRGTSPVIETVRALILGDFTLRVAGEKWHDVTLEVAQGALSRSVTVVRTPGNPSDQSATLQRVGINLLESGSVTLRYTPEDDPINGQPNGANPVTVIFRSGDAEAVLRHTFNARAIETAVWTTTDLAALLPTLTVRFQAQAIDRGSDDLTFTWSFGDGTSPVSHIYYNDGAGPDPPGSTRGNFPFTVWDAAAHAFLSAWPHTVVLTVTDDDGGTTSLSATITS